MRNQITYTASVLSTNEVEFSFPYNGGSQLGLGLRTSSKSNDIIFAITKGQFGCIDDCTLAVKFDDGEVENYPLAKASNGGSSIFIKDKNNVQKFALNLKKAKKLIVELPFYSEGRKQFHFNVEGLEWKHF